MLKQCPSPLMKRAVLNKTRIVADQESKNPKLASVHWSAEVTFFRKDAKPENKLITTYLTNLDEKASVANTLLSYDYWLGKVGSEAKVLATITGNKESFESSSAKAFLKAFMLKKSEVEEGEIPEELMACSLNAAAPDSKLTDLLRGAMIFEMPVFYVCL
mgnify:FL=1